MDKKKKSNLVIGIIVMLVILIPLIVHEWHHTGFFVGVFDGFMVIPLIVIRMFTDINVVSALNMPYLGGYTCGIIALLAWTVHSLETPDNYK
jgi:hypothetical protein